MNRYWFRVRINRKEDKVVKVLIQAPGYEVAGEILKAIIKHYYPYDPDFDILNNAQDMPDDKTYAVIGDNESTHYVSMLHRGGSK